MKYLIFLITILLCSFTSAMDMDHITVAVIDTGVPSNSEAFKRCYKMPDRDLTGTGLQDLNGHATNVANIIKNTANSEDVCYVFIKYTNGRDSGIEKSNEALRIAIEYGVDIINYSSSGAGYSTEEKEILKVALKNNIIVVAAAGNDGKNLDRSCDAFPACYGFKLPMLIVGCKDYNANHGKVVTIKEKCYKVVAGGFTMTGSSQATAKITGRMLAYFKKHKNKTKTQGRKR